MNDFTKEELKTLLDLFHYAADSPCWRSTEGWNDVLQVKITAMIDSYCEHESSDPMLVLVKNCIKCKGHLETRPWGLNDNP